MQIALGGHAGILSKAEVIAGQGQQRQALRPSRAVQLIDIIEDQFGGKGQRIVWPHRSRGCPAR